MSKYENYDKISLTYDETRTAVGVEIILGFLASMPRPLNELLILDAGCGTGNYAYKLREKISRVVCADLSLGMLQQYKKKSLHKNLDEDLVQCDLSELPFAENLFDAIICNQSLHHLDDPEEDFPNQKRFFEHAYRSLKPDGLLIINTITHEQLHDGVWWGKLIKPAVERMTHRFTPCVRLVVTPK
ncbi:MAG: class I SAM-dependent methyltransferase [Tatlockia sp.]|nr:class I SAM-dependent methyltransferase [Tatlockia sp.]